MNAGLPFDQSNTTAILEKYPRPMKLSLSKQQRNREMQQFSQYARWRLQNSMLLSYCFQIRTK